MAFIDLLVRVGADASGFNSTLKQTERQADGFAGRFGAKFTRMFAVGAALGIARSITSGFLEMGRNIEGVNAELDKFNAKISPEAAKMIKETSNEWDMLWAKFKQGAAETGGPFMSGFFAPIFKAVEGMSYLVSIAKDFVTIGGKPGAWLDADMMDTEESILKGLRGDPAAESQAGRDAYVSKKLGARQKVQEKLLDEQEKTYMASLTSEEKLYALTYKRALLQKAITDGQLVNIDNILAARIDIEQMTQQINALVKAGDKPEAKAVKRSIFGGAGMGQPIDALATIGGYTRSVDPGTRSWQENMLRHAEDTARNTANLKIL